MTSQTTLSTESAAALEGLEPANFWKLFGALTQVPRQSRHEQVVREYIETWAGSHGLTPRSDAAGNMVIDVPATAGHEQAPKVVLQGHLDIVCEREPDSPNDPAAGRIELRRDGVWLTADGTTLGADDGVAIAAMQALVEDADVVHGPLQLLMTVAEEVGLEGANGLDPSLVDGAVLINLDSEEDGRLTVGCAGSTDSWIRIDAPRTTVDDAAWFTITVSGGAGGHSGTGIATGRSNAVKVLGAALTGAANGAPSLRLHTLNGGKSRNAIPRNADATVAVATGEVAAFTAALETHGARIAQAFSISDAGVRVTAAPTSAADTGAWSTSDTRRMLDAIDVIPSGPLAMSQTIDGLVEMSSSLGEALTEGDTLVLHSLSRSSNDQSMPDLIASLEGIAQLAGGTCELKFNYAGWQPDPTSDVLKAAKRVFERTFGFPAIVTGVHAGLETAVIGAKVPGLDMIAIGPQIEHPHSPDERVDVETVTRFWLLLRGLLEELATPSSN